MVMTPSMSINRTPQRESISDASSMVIEAPDRSFVFGDHARVDFVVLPHCL
jgi:hypothetical protein